MDWHWPLAIIIVATLLFAYCTYSTQQGSQSIDRALDSLDQQACYEAGYNAGLAGGPQPRGPADNPDCVRSLQSGYETGRQAFDAFERYYGDGQSSDRP
jgi:hypothetical protein